MTGKIYEDRQFLTNYSMIIRSQISENWKQLNDFIRTIYAIITLSFLALPFIYNVNNGLFFVILLLGGGGLSILSVAYLSTFRGIMSRLYKTLIKIDSLLGLFDEDLEMEKKLPHDVSSLMMADEVKSILPRKWMTNPQILQFGPNIYTFNFLFFIIIAAVYLGTALWVIFS